MDVTVPGAWDFYSYPLRNYEGVGWYYAQFPAIPGKDVQHLLDFTRVGGRAWVWVNGTLAGNNALCYLPFDIDIQKHLKPAELNQVVVKVDNSFRGDKHLAGGKKVEWVLYGGLTHKILLVAAAKCRIEHIDAKADASGKADIVVTVRNDSSEDFYGQLGLGLDTKLKWETKTAVQCPSGQKTKVQLCMEAKSFIPWSPDKPMLYNLSVRLMERRKKRHQASVRIGFRTIECQGTRILLNGKPIYLQGVNRYDEYEPYGTSVPEHLLRQELEQIKSCGVNMVRVHYPQDPLHLEIADELGLLYMLEVPLCWWRPDSLDTLDDDFAELQAEAKETVDRTYEVFGNHPCWVAWNMSNECNFSQTCIGLVSMLAERARKLKCGRLITNATCDEPGGNDLEFCDFIGINLYFGAWNTARKFSELTKLIVERTRKRLELIVKLYPDKPIVVCEFGALSIKGLKGGSRICEDRHAEHLKLTAKIFRKNKRVCGMLVWAWADYFHNRNFLDLGQMHIHSLFGPYGVVTVDRKIKDGPYRALQEIFAQPRPGHRNKAVTKNSKDVSARES